MITLAEMVGKIKAAVDTRQDPDLVIIARSDARAVEGLQAAIDRVNAYLEAGADVGFVEAPQNVEELRIVGRQVRGPALVNVFEGGKTPMVPASELEAMGFRLGIYPRRPIAPRSAPRKGCCRAEGRRRHHAASKAISPPSRSARTRSAPPAGAPSRRNICGPISPLAPRGHCRRSRPV